MAAPGDTERGRGVLSMVGTPIGNLSDASPRVIDTLRSADLLLCEDTRVTGRLLAHFGVRVPLLRADENVLPSRIHDVLARVGDGERVALVSDAGMPAVSDPGQRLVDAALDAGLRVEVIPGPSAVVCALVASGLASDHFFFEGFLPRKRGERDRRLATLARVPATLVLYESPHRVVATLEAVASVMPERRVALVRELTKLHEECVRGPAARLAAEVSERAGREALRGECVIVIEGPRGGEVPGEAPEQPLEEAIAAGLASGEPKPALARRLARGYGRPRSEVYDQILRASDA